MAQAVYASSIPRAAAHPPARAHLTARLPRLKGWNLAIAVIAINPVIMAVRLALAAGGVHG